MQGQEAIRMALEVLFAVVGFFAVFVLREIRKSIDETKKSVDELNIKVATVIEKTANHEKQLDIHGERIFQLEKGAK